MFSKSKEEHTKHVRIILQKLIKAGLQVDIRKSEFNVQKTKFLGLIILKDRIEMDLEKIKAIVEWKLPRNV